MNHPRNWLCFLHHPRYRLVHILQEHGITPCLWAKDVLYFNGVWHQCLGDLCLLVPDQDLETAAKIISSLPEFRQTAPDEEYLSREPDWRYLSQYWPSRFEGPDEDNDCVQLLPAKEFAEMEISEETTVRHEGLVYLKLACYIESLIYQYLLPAKAPAESLFVINDLEILSEELEDPEEVSRYLSGKAQRLWSDLVVKEEMILLRRNATKISMKYCAISE